MQIPVHHLCFFFVWKNVINALTVSNTTYPCIVTVSKVIPETDISIYSFRFLLFVMSQMNHSFLNVHRGKRNKWLHYMSGGSLVRYQVVSLEFFIDIKSFRFHYGPGIDSASNRNENQEHLVGGKGGRCVRLTTYHHPVPLS